MKIISHRGYWVSTEEKNSIIAFERSFSKGYGTETDVRDANQELVISHDMPLGNEMSLKDFLTLAEKYSKELGVQITLALNIKADGLYQKLISNIKNFKSLDVFVFDMAIPDMLSYINGEIQVFTRLSEIEREPVFFENSAGVWLDSFYGEWYDANLIDSLLSEGKKVCIVSSELHKRPYEKLWEMLRGLINRDNLILCTDFPEQAYDFIIRGNKNGN